MAGKQVDLGVVALMDRSVELHDAGRRSMSPMAVPRCGHSELHPSQGKHCPEREAEELERNG